MLRLSTTLLINILFVLTLYGQDNWYIQVGAFDQQVDNSYFNKLGNKILYAKDTYGFHRYYKGVSTQEEANEQMSELRALGYNCVLVEKDELGNTCRCNYIPIPVASNTSNPIPSFNNYTSINRLRNQEVNSLKNIFFNFDQYTLTNEATVQLDNLLTILRQFPEYHVNLLAHTDSKGSNEYNDILSLKRAKSTKQYLQGNGINSTRIKMESYGEIKPIAKNELDDGADSELGRRLNRRVEIVILDQDGHVINGLVDEINTPTNLLSAN